MTEAIERSILIWVTSLSLSLPLPHNLSLNSQHGTLTLYTGSIIFHTGKQLSRDQSADLVFNELIKQQMKFTIIVKTCPEISI
jgi:hypothetical protein